VFGTEPRRQADARRPPPLQRGFQPLGAVHRRVRAVSAGERLLVEVRRLPERHGLVVGRRDGRLRAVQGQGQLQLVPRRWKRDDSDQVRPTQQGRDGGTSVHLLRLGNEGLPINRSDAFYYQTTPDFFGFTGNPYGFAYETGMGTFLRSGFGSGPNPNPNWTPLAPMVDGQFQVSTARNVAMSRHSVQHGGARTYFRRSFPQRLHQEPEAARPTSTTRATSIRSTSPQDTARPDDRESGLLASARGPVSNDHRHDDRDAGLTDQEENQIVAFCKHSRMVTRGLTRTVTPSRGLV